MIKRNTTGKTAVAPKKTVKGATKTRPITTGNVVVKWSSLNRVDNFRGARTHNIQVIMDDALESLLTTTAQSMGAQNVNGISEKADPDTGESSTYFKAKSRTHVGDSDDSKFPNVFDASGNKTDKFPFGGDIVRLKLYPKVLDADGSVSFYLTDVQIVQKNSSGGPGGSAFDAVDGWTDESTESDTSDDPQIHF